MARMTYAEAVKMIYDPVEQDVDELYEAIMTVITSPGATQDDLLQAELACNRFYD